MKPFHLVLPLCLAALPATSVAADFCVTNGGQLRTILNLAVGNGQSDRIRLRVGTYVHPDGESFQYHPAKGDQTSIEISGGWVQGEDGPCTRQATSRTPFDTVIVAGVNKKALDIEPPLASSMDVRIEWIAFTGGNGPRSGNGLRIYSFANAESSITVENCAFVGNSGTGAAALWIRSHGTTYLRNSLVEGNLTSGDSVALVNALGPGIAYVSNLTVVDNARVFSSSDGAGLHVRADDSGRAVVANNHLWGNDGLDLVLRSRQNSEIIASNNNVEALDERPDGSSSVVVVGAMSVASAYEPGPDTSFVPAQGSPLIDAGIDPQSIEAGDMPWANDWSLGAVDLLDTPRIMGAAVDIGAFEARQAGVFRDGFE